MRPQDYQTPVWGRVERFLSDRIEKLQRQLECIGISEREADVVRGQIFECRFLLSRPVQAETPQQSPEFSADI